MKNTGLSGFVMKLEEVFDGMNVPLAGLCLMFVSVLFPTAGHTETIGNTLRPQFQFSTASAGKPVITYSLHHAMLINQDQVPLLQVYGNGKVHAHFPQYMKKAGDYQMQLSQPELIELLRSLEQDGVLDFDHQSAKSYKVQADAQRRSNSGTFFHTSDTTETVIEIKLDAYQRHPLAKRMTNFSKTFNWKNLERDAKRYTQSSEIKRAAASAQRLHSLLERAGSAKIK